MTLKTPPRPPREAREILDPLAHRADELGITLYAVGGCVRDWLLGRATHDLDLVCESDPKPLAAECARLQGGAVESFGQFGTLRVLSEGAMRVDFATSRREQYPEPASLPVVAPAPIEEDLKRRDFTVNALALALNGPRAGRLLDPFGGAADLAAGKLRLLHDASLRDDPTRVFRAARYACRLSLKPDADLARQAAAALGSGHASRLSPHRLTQELLRLLGEAEVACPLRLLKGWGYLALWHPRLKAPPAELRGVEERLGAMAVALDGQGPDFLNKLALDRRISGDLHELLKLVQEKKAAKDEIPAAARSVLKALQPDLPTAALKPLLLTGQDLKTLGLPPGPRYKELLDEAAGLQWKGKLTTRTQAVSWLKAKARA